MSRRRKSLAELQATGAHLRNPSRFRDQPDADPTSTPDEPLDPYPPIHLSVAAAERYEHFVVHFPWLRLSHTALVECACILGAKLALNPGDVKGCREYQKLMHELGGTPAGRERLKELGVEGVE